jgi:hypothetical protein
MRALSMSLNTLLGRSLLALALLFGQQHAALHWLSHAVEATQAKAGTPATDLHCDDCLAVAGLGAAATASAPMLPASFARHALTSPLPTADAPSALRLAFRSRAPPILG